MKRVKNQRGFSLVEVTIVLAIFALLLAAAFVGRGLIYRNTSFYSAVDQLKSRLVSIQNESQSSVKTATVATGGGNGKSTQTTFGKVVEFDPASPTRMTAFTLLTSDDTTDRILRACDREQITIPNGLNYLGTNRQALVFANIDSQVKTFVPPIGYTPQPITTSPDCSSIGGSPAPQDPENDGDLPPPPQCNDGIDNDTVPDHKIDAADPDCHSDRNAANAASYVAADDDENPPPQCSDGVDNDVDGRTDFPDDGGCTDSGDNDEAGGIPGGPCNLAGYRCGLIGEYYRGLRFDAGGTRQPMSRYLDTQIGTNLGAGGTSWPDFKPTLRARTAQNIAQYASVKWTGWINLAEGPHTLCTNSDDGSYFKIDVMGDFNLDTGDLIFNDFTAGHSPTENCRTITILSGRGGWRKIEIGYNNNYVNGEGGAAIRFYRQGSVTDFPTADLRSDSSVAVCQGSGPGCPPPKPIGMYGRYWRDGNVWDGYQNEIGTFLDPDFGYSPMAPWTASELGRHSLSSGEGFLTRWDNQYLHIPTTQQYRFCFEADDGFQWDINGTPVIWSYTPGNFCVGGGTPNTAPWFNVPAGQYGISIWFNNTGGPAHLRWLYQEQAAPGVTKDIPDEWLSYDNYHYNGDVPPVITQRNSQLAELNLKGLINKIAQPAYAAAPASCTSPCDILDSSNYLDNNPQTAQFRSSSADFEFGFPSETSRGTIIIDTGSGSIQRRITQ